MEVKLIVASGKNAGQVIPVSGRKFFIGRAEDCNVRPHSDLVSRHHCVILVEEGFVAVRDFGSKNGTFVNGERIKAEQELKPGDQLKVGDLEFEIQLDVPVGGKKKPKVHSVQEAATRTAESVRGEGLLGEEEDFDVTELVGEETGRVAPDTETQILLPSEPDLDFEIPPPPPVPKAEKPKPDREEEEGKQPDIEGVWKGTAKKKPAAASSRDAAASMLKQLFRSHLD